MRLRPLAAAFPEESAMPDTAALRLAIRAAHRADEETLLASWVGQARFDAPARARIRRRAEGWVESIRAGHGPAGAMDAFLREYGLSSREGLALMCLAEALLRIPDAETADRLIKDQLGHSDWRRHLGHSDSLLVNASTWALMLTGRLAAREEAGEALGTLLARAGEPFVRQAAIQAMRLLGRQFVMGQTLAEALRRAEDAERRGYRHSYDMLGEAARTMAAARRYFDAYAEAVSAIGQARHGAGVYAAPGLSVKLSALHPRYEPAQRGRVMGELLPALKRLALDAKAAGIGLTLDAEEADRLELSLDLVEALALDPALAGWDGLGLAVQAYQKRALAVVDWLADLARRGRRRLAVRLVKGAYWDAEIKLAQTRGLADYPVFTRKAGTDVSYLACARRLLAAPDAFYPAFATHNAQTLAAVMELAGPDGDYELQRLHGMGEALHAQIVPTRPCRVYAPVGGHGDLLAYLVRRLLENGANLSFVHCLADPATPVEALLADPADTWDALPAKRPPRLPKPGDLYAPGRKNSAGLDLCDAPTLAALAQAVAASRARRYQAGPLVGGVMSAGTGLRPVANPADPGDGLGAAAWAGEGDVAAAMAQAAAAQRGWDATPAGRRAGILERAADLMEARTPALVALIVREGGRTLADAAAEVRESVDFLRYYAGQARLRFAEPVELPGPVGERNRLRLCGRGVFVCISPWNFPLAIFTGQAAAALAAGNAVAAKPAEQTPLTACEAVRLLHEAGVPAAVLHCLPGDGRIGAALVAHPLCAGVAFTGSTDTAKAIARSLAAKPGPIVPLIAETGGVNCMVADSSAPVEQVARDVLSSAFNSAGQRCSALRVLFAQADIADRLLAEIEGAMAELSLGDPALPGTDVGPLIEAGAQAALEDYARRLDAEARLIYRCRLPEHLRPGHFFPPCAYEIGSLAQIPGEVFGPVLHVIRFPGDGLDAALDSIDALGYGLTLGVHSRVDALAGQAASRVRAGNLYVNRDMIGAVVGAQPFGGEGLSGTGPKAGGPNYLPRFAVERVMTVDTTARGGNASLLGEDESG
jgi:RHH-type proline utilization regulon transcriptional repressor/proline dehydrogenase/delta 1-pyrroline-5-carboxylate dehydrogenase